MENTVGNMFLQMFGMNFAMFVLFIVIHAILLGWLASYVGKTKGIKNGFWFGFLLGELGLLTVGLCSPKNASNTYSKIKNKEIEKEAKMLYEKGYLTERTYRDIINEK